MADLKVFTGNGKPAPEKAGDIADKIHDLIMENCQGMPIATVAGILDIVKHEILVEQL